MTWSDLPAKLKTYISVLSVLAFVVATWTIWDLSVSSHSSGWIVLTFFIVAAVPFSLILPSASAGVLIGDAFAMAIGMMYGTAPCIVATFFQSTIISIFGQRSKRHLYRIVFNSSSTVCCAWLYSSVYQLLNHGSSQLRDIVIPSVVLALTYFLANSLMTSLAIAWSMGDSVLKYWVRTCLPLIFDFSISVVIAAIIVVLNDINEFLPYAAAPLIGIIWGWNKLNKSRVTEAERHLKEQEDLYLRTVESLALAVDAKDQTTYGHIRRVRVYAIGMAGLCGIKDPSELKAIETGALLHDIGKLAVDDYILNKPGRLSKEEFEKIKLHASAGDEILQQVDFPFPVARYVRYHHERWDGQGYPDGLKGEGIPLGARILAIADAFDAIRFSRPYKLSMATDEALEILRTQAGIAFDPELVKLFIAHICELEQAALEQSESVPELSFRRCGAKEEQALSAASPGPTTPQSIPAEMIRLAELCNAISGHLELQDVLQVLARQLRKLIPFNTCAFYMRTADSRIKAVSVTGELAELLGGRALEIGRGISGWVAAYGHPMINTDPALDFQGLPGDFTSFSDALSVPIFQENEAVGTISLYAKEPVAYRQHDLNIIKTVAGFLSPIISEIARSAATPEDVVDPNTGIHRVSYLSAIAPQLISAANRNHLPVSLIYLDIRNFGQITRLYGSNTGKSLLKRIAECIRRELRETDILVRYGYQGFAALLIGVSDDQALRCIHRIRQHLRSESVGAGQNAALECRAGAAFYPKDGATVLALLQSAQESIRALSDATMQDGKVLDFSPRT